MATIDDAASIALALPEVTEQERNGIRSWKSGMNPSLSRSPFRT